MTEPIDQSAPIGNPLVRLRREGSKWIASSRHGERGASSERASAVTAVLAGLANVGVELDPRSARILRALETFEKIERVPPNERPYGYNTDGCSCEEIGYSITGSVLWLTYASDEAILQELRANKAYISIVRDAIREEAAARGLVP